MQVLIILASIVVILIVFGFPILPILMGIFYLLEGVACLSALFFLVMAILLLFSRKKKAAFLELEEGEHSAMFAVYEIEGEEHRNTFPTDGFLGGLLYRKKDVSVRMLRLGKSKLVFDKITMIIIGIGLPAFAFLSVFLFILVQSI